MFATVTNKNQNSNSSQPNEIQLLDVLAEATWNRIRFGEITQIRQGEETITDNNLLELAIHSRSTHVIKTSKNKETIWGCDWEWWIGINGKWLRYAVQAKKINSDTLKYDHLNHKVKNDLQINLLEKFSHDNGAIPIYCFYNYVDSWRLSSRGGGVLSQYWNCCNSSFKNVSDPIFGCTVTPSRVVKQILSNSSTKKRSFQHIHANDATRPWSCLLKCPEIFRMYNTGSKSDLFGDYKLYQNLPSSLNRYIDDKREKDLIESYARIDFSDFQVGADKGFLHDKHDRIVIPKWIVIMNLSYNSLGERDFIR